MAITVYGSVLCPATLRFVTTLSNHGVQQNFVNITGSIGLLKEFVTFRDTSPLFDDVRGSGKVGIPMIELEDGTRTLDTKAVLKMLGIEEDGSAEKK
ncbi:MAG: glutaredoxin [Clostridiales bacterium]|nr:glutaredoxin [Clostridiales bacterium]